MLLMAVHWQSTPARVDARMPIGSMELATDWRYGSKEPSHGCVDRR
jgi:hypothetical protein